MKRTSSEHYCFIFSNSYQNNDNIGSGFPPTSCHIPPTSGSSDWPKWDPHMTYKGLNCPGSQTTSQSPAWLPLQRVNMPIVWSVSMTISEAQLLDQRRLITRYYMWVRCQMSGGKGEVRSEETFHNNMMKRYILISRPSTLT